MIVINLCLYKILPAEHRGISEQEGNATCTQQLKCVYQATPRPILRVGTRKLAAK